MKERPILFSGPMVRALLAGRKTQTRRTVKLAVPSDADEVFFWSGDDLRRQGFSNVADTGLWARKNGRDGYLRFIGRCPYGSPGDQLWVKETHAVVPRSSYAMSVGVQQTLKPDDGHDAAVYAADWERSKPGRWRPSIHMPRWASRLTLGVTDVRAERLQDISAADAYAEGGDPVHMQPGGAQGDPSEGWLCYRAGFESLWASINGPDGWAANPWVWVVSFEVLRADTPTTPARGE